MIQIECPNCGVRNSLEFRYGGEYSPRPPKPMEASEAEWVDFLFFKDNKQGIQKEWWYHRAGCGLWFLAERHTRSNKVEKTYLWQTAGGGD